ncbi:hypothetical protein SBV45_03865 [Chlamydia crocodili]|uniref:Inner membrane protein n=1 Tax=Chlamydia crocodili TaxID=2766982 RepID=A0ABX8CDL6_9CHLA|nr:hypothetical protein [Chlamydia crocodili]QVE49108.1 hypothetical protein H9Q19_00045 [Chlamydia crocodili]
MLSLYETNLDFFNQTRKHPCLMKNAYVREASTSHTPCLRMGIEDITLFSCSSLKSSVLSSLPILGTIRGFARLYSTWSVKDRSNDQLKDQVTHTLLGIFEVLGLGAALLVVKIAITALIYISFVLFMLFGMFYEIASTQFQKLPCFAKQSSETNKI